MLSYLLDPEFEFWISGRWTNGGLVEIYHDGYSAGGLRLPRVRWAVFATLAQQAAQAQSQTHAFMTAEEMLAVLRRRNVLQTRDPNRVVRLVHELRNDLNEAKAKKFQKTWGNEQRKWGKRAIETNQLGYRLSLQPENIHVEILKADPDVPPQQVSSGPTPAFGQRSTAVTNLPDGLGPPPFGAGAHR